MGIRQRVAQWLLKGATSGTENPSQWFLDWIGGGSKSKAGVTISQMTALQDVTVMACVMIRAGDLAKCPVHVYSISENGQQVIQPKHAAERLLRQPNDWQTPLEFFEQMQAALLLRSNAYAAIKRNGRGEPIALIPINPDRVSLYEASDGDLFYQTMRGNNFERGELRDFPQMIPSSEMLHLRGMTVDGITGLSRIWMAKESIGLSLAMEQTAARLFGNGAHPTIVLTTDKNVTDDLHKRTRAAFRERNQGLENVGDLMLLGGGVKPTQVQMNMVDAQFAENEQRQMGKIARAFDVPGHRIGLALERTQGSILETHQMYLNNVISTDASRWEQKLEQLFNLDGTNIFIEFDLDTFNRADLATRTESGRVAVVGGLSTPNEFRRREGQKGLPGGDTLFRPMNVVPMNTPVQQPGAGPGSDTTGKPAPGGDGDPSGLPGKATGNGHDPDWNWHGNGHDHTVNPLASTFAKLRLEVADLKRQFASEGSATREEMRQVLEATLDEMRNVKPAEPSTVNVSVAPAAVDVKMPEQTFNLTVPEREMKIEPTVVNVTVPERTVEPAVINLTVPEREMNVEINMPKNGAHRVDVTAHTEDGRIKSFTKTPIDSEQAP